MRKDIYIDIYIDIGGKNKKNNKHWKKKTKLIKQHKKIGEKTSLNI